MSEWLQTVIENGGMWCKNCDSAWRALIHEFEYSRSSVEAGQPRVIEECYGCDDEAFDIYEVEDDGP